jgi:hypothetical protein
MFSVLLLVHVHHVYESPCKEGSSCGSIINGHSHQRSYCSGESASTSESYSASSHGASANTTTSAVEVVGHTVFLPQQLLLVKAIVFSLRHVVMVCLLPLLLIVVLLIL